MRNGRGQNTNLILGVLSLFGSSLLGGFHSSSVFGSFLGCGFFGCGLLGGLGSSLFLSLLFQCLGFGSGGSGLLRSSGSLALGGVQLRRQRSYLCSQLINLLLQVALLRQEHAAYNQCRYQQHRKPSGSRFLHDSDIPPYC